MIYRTATHEDLSFLMEFEQQLAKEKPDLPYWENMSVATHPMLNIERMTVAEDEYGIPVGMVGSIPLNEESWYLVNLYVRPEFRGAGIARSLVAKAAEIQREYGRTSVMAIVSDKVGNLYEKMGFKQVGKAMALETA